MAKPEGWMMIDHRASPGMPEEVLRKAGISMPIVGEGKVVEMGIIQCVHCQRHVIKNPDRTRERGYCPKCDGFICDICSLNARASDYVHRPFKKVVDDVLESGLRNLDLPPLLRG